MNDIQKYWRDRVKDLLQWGTALFVLFAGWAVQSQEKFRLIGAHWPAQRDEIMAAIGLLAVSVCYAPLLPMAILYVYKRFLNAETDATVLPYRFAMTSAFILSVLTLTVAIFMPVF